MATFLSIVLDLVFGRISIEKEVSQLKPKVVIVFSGKRKSGKDFIAELLNKT